MLYNGEKPSNHILYTPEIFQKLTSEKTFEPLLKHSHLSYEALNSNYIGINKINKTFKKFRKKTQNEPEKKHSGHFQTILNNSII